jgi:hypothetical protein
LERKGRDIKKKRYLKLVDIMDNNTNIKPKNRKKNSGSKKNKKKTKKKKKQERKVKHKMGANYQLKDSI